MKENELEQKREEAPEQETKRVKAVPVPAFFEMADDEQLPEREMQFKGRPQGPAFLDEDDALTAVNDNANEPTEVKNEENKSDVSVDDIIADIVGKPKEPEVIDDDDELTKMLADRKREKEKTLGGTPEEVNVLGVNVKLDGENIKETIAKQASQSNENLTFSENIFSSVTVDKTDKEMDRMVNDALDDEAEEKTEINDAPQTENVEEEAVTEEIRQENNPEQVIEPPKPEEVKAPTNFFDMEDDEFGFLSDEKTRFRPKTEAPAAEQKKEEAPEQETKRVKAVPVPAFFEMADEEQLPEREMQFKGRPQGPAFLDEDDALTAVNDNANEPTEVKNEENKSDVSVDDIIADIFGKPNEPEVIDDDDDLTKMLADRKRKKEETLGRTQEEVNVLGVNVKLDGENIKETIAKQASQSNENLTFSENIFSSVTVDKTEGVKIKTDKEMDRMVKDALDDEAEEKAEINDFMVRKPKENLDDYIANTVLDETEPKVTGVAENKTEAPVNEEPARPLAADFFRGLRNRIRSTEITAQVKSEIAEILKSAGITEKQAVDQLTDKSFADAMEHVKLLYNPGFVSETKMSVDAPSFFYAAYQSLTETDLDSPEHIIAAQKIANVIIKNYSPVAFTDKELDHYANDYVLNNRDDLESQLKSLGFANPEAAMEEVAATLRGEPIKKQEPLEEPQNAPDPESVDMAEFTKGLEPVLNNTEEYQGYNVYGKLAIKNALRNEGIDVGEESDPLGYVDIIRDAYAPEKLSRETVQPMREIAKSLFVSTYNALTQKGINPKDKIETTQKVTSELINRYSPAFINDDLLKYGNNYITGDNKILRECLTALKLPEKEIKALADDRIDGRRLHNNVKMFTEMPSTNARVNSNVAKILKESGVAEDLTNALDPVEIINDAYKQEKIPNRSIPMREVAKQVFISTYNALTKKGLTPDNKIEATQRIADELLKNYSPVTYTEQKLNEYANNYVTGDKEILGECLTTLKLPEEQINAAVGDVKELEKENTEKKEQVENVQPTTPVNSEARIAVYMEKLKAYNKMYKLDIDSNNFAASVTDAWELMTSGDTKKIADGKKVMSDLFKDTLKKAFDVEKGVAYDEHRLPEYAEIVRSSNELMRSAMYGFTDMYHNRNRAGLFDSTAFGGLDAKEIAELTAGDSLWSMDQKSDAAWEIQSKEAKGIADKWLKEDKPYEKMINEMKELVAENKNSVLSRKEILDKLTAAEWLLVNNEKMMVDDPEDPLNRIPNWGNRYWKTLIETRDALGIDKYTSMRDLIQADFEASAKAVNNRNYNETQINDYVLDQDVRELSDSMEVQKEQFATQSAAVILTDPKEEKTQNDPENDQLRYRLYIKELDQKKLEKEAPRGGEFIIEKTSQLEFVSEHQANR